MTLGDLIKQRVKGSGRFTEGFVAASFALLHRPHDDFGESE